MLIIDSIKKSTEFLMHLLRSKYFFILLGISTAKISLDYFIIPDVGELTLLSLRYVFTGLTILIPMEVLESIIIIPLVAEFYTNDKFESRKLHVISRTSTSFIYLLFLTLVTDLITGIGFLLLIVPGIFFMMYFVFLSQIFLIDNIRSLKIIYSVGKEIAYKYWTQIILYLLIIPIPSVVLAEVSSLQLLALIYDQAIILLSMIIFSFMYLQIRKEFIQDLTN